MWLVAIQLGNLIMQGRVDAGGDDEVLKRRMTLINIRVPPSRPCKYQYLHATGSFRGERQRTLAPLHLSIAW